MLELFSPLVAKDAIINRQIILSNICNYTKKLQNATIIITTDYTRKYFLITCMDLYAELNWDEFQENLLTEALVNVMEEKNIYNL